MRHVLLGLPALEALGVVKFLDSVASKKSDYEVLCPQVFNNLGTMPGEYTIRLHPDAVPFAVSAPRRIPIPLQEPVDGTNGRYS